MFGRWIGFCRCNESFRIRPSCGDRPGSPGVYPGWVCVAAATLAMLAPARTHAAFGLSKDFSSDDGAAAVAGDTYGSAETPQKLDRSLVLTEFRVSSMDRDDGKEPALEPDWLSNLLVLQQYRLIHSFVYGAGDRGAPESDLLPIRSAGRALDDLRKVPISFLRDDLPDRRPYFEYFDDARQRVVAAPAPGGLVLSLTGIVCLCVRLGRKRHNRPGYSLGN